MARRMARNEQDLQALIAETDRLAFFQEALRFWNGLTMNAVHLPLSLGRMQQGQVGPVHFREQPVAVTHPSTTEHMVDVSVGEHKPHRLQCVVRQPCLQLMFLSGIRTSRIHHDGLMAMVEHPCVLLKGVEGELGGAQNVEKSKNFAVSFSTKGDESSQPRYGA
jgi:hypothetical protein